MPLSAASVARNDRTLAKGAAGGQCDALSRSSMGSALPLRVLFLLLAALLVPDA